MLCMIFELRLVAVAAVGRVVVPMSYGKSVSFIYRNVHKLLILIDLKTLLLCVHDLVQCTLSEN